MNHRITTDRAAAVCDHKWIKIDKNTPIGVKVMLINKQYRAATQGQHFHGNNFFTHWFPLPTFDENEKE